MEKRTIWIRCLAFSAACSLLGSLAHAGSNEGFTATLASPVKVTNPEVGDLIKVVVRVAHTTSVKNSTIRIRYEVEFFEFVDHIAGNHPAGNPLFAFPEGPFDEGNGFSNISLGSATFGALDTSGGGILGTLNFRVLKELEEDDKFISVYVVGVGASGADLDELTFESGEFGVSVVPDFPNKIFEVDVQASHNGAIVSWKTRDAGFDDVVSIQGEDSPALLAFTNPFQDRVTTQVREALQTLREAGVDPTEADAEEIRNALGLSAPGPGVVDPLSEFFEEIRVAGRFLKERSHLVPITGLTPNTNYAFRIRSTGLTGRLSPVFEGQFQTRLQPDLRRLLASNVDVQARRRGINIRFDTNRLATTDYSIQLDGEEDILQSGTVNEDGTKLTRIAINKLQPNTLYLVTLVANLIASEIADELPAEKATTTIVRTIKTRALGKAPKLAGPPFKIVGPESAQIQFRTTLPVSPVVSYGLVPDDATSDVVTADSYMWTADGEEEVDHGITLTGLDPSTLYRYKIEFQLEDEGTIIEFSTAPGGNFQWSRDLTLMTSSAADVSIPELVFGPLVHTVDILAIVSFATDVATTTRILIGTVETFNTPDEFEFTDQVFSGFHSIIVAGLDAGVGYLFRIEFTASNGQVGTFEPPEPTLGKVARALQPRGGAGSFTTSNVPDTQFPVILTGPTVASKTHDTAIVEWTTDEPGDSEVRFGLDNTDETETSGTSETSHKMVISDLEPGTTYSYLVASTDAVGNGATESGTAVFTTDPEIDLTAPEFTSAPEVVYKSDEQATIQWTTNEDATGEVNFGLDDQLGFIRSLPITEKVHEITLTNLEANTDYFFTASSTDLSNNGPTISETLFFTTDAGADLTSPLISSVQVAVEDESAILSWDTDEVADSFVDFGVVSGLADLIVGNFEDVAEHQIVLTNLTPDTEYFFTVGSIDRASNPPTRSEESSFTTLASADTEAPGTPTDLSATAGSQQVLLTWAANTELDLAGYSVFRRISGETDFTEIATRLTETIYTDLGLTNDVTYEYQLTAIDRADNPSVATDPLPLTPTALAAPSAPSDLAREGDNFLRPTFVFTNPLPIQDGAELAYTVQVSTEADFGNVTASESGISSGAGGADSGQTAWVITRDLTEGATYYWRVRAIEGDLIGAFSDAQEFIAREVVLLPGDFNDDGVVSLPDFFLFAQNFSQSATGDRAVFDLNGNGAIDLPDFFLFAQNFGATSNKRWAFAHVMDEIAELNLQALGGTRAEDGRVTLRVWVDAVTDLKGFGLVLAYDSDALTFLQAEAGPGHLLHSRGGQAPLFQVLNERPGHLVLANAITAGQAVSGRGLLAEITFQTRGGAPTNDAVFDLREAYFVGDRNPERVRRVRQVGSTRLQPLTYFLGANFPNPFNPVTSIEYALPTTAGVELTVFDILGRQVKTLVDDPSHPAGFYTATWDGRDQRGRTAGNGLYFYRIRTNDFRQTGKMLLLK